MCGGGKRECMGGALAKNDAEDVVAGVTFDISSVWLFLRT